MRQPTQDFTAGRFSPSSFDTELPPAARAEFFRPRSSGRKTVREPLDRYGTGALIGIVAFLVIAILLIAVAIERGRAPANSPPLVQPTPDSVQRAPAPAVPRAQLIRTPAPRAQLVALPFWEPGTARLLRMPYDTSYTVRGVLKGYLGSESLLPQSGNHIGDTWIVGHTPWVFVQVPGTTAPTWVDP